MNRNPKIIAIIPIIIDEAGMMLLTGFTMVAPINTVVNPKKSRLNPTINETSAAENIGKIIMISKKEHIEIFGKRF